MKPTTTHQLLREQEGCIVITLQSPRGKAQNVFLVLLDFGHGPVLTLQTFLLTLSHLLQVKENSLIKESRALGRILLHPGYCHVSHQQKQTNTISALNFTWASLTRTRPRLFSSFMICRMAILTSTCTRFCTSDTWRILMDKSSQARNLALGPQ